MIIDLYNKIQIFRAITFGAEYQMYICTCKTKVFYLHLLLYLLVQEVVRKYRYILEPIGRESRADETAVTLIITCVPRVFLSRALFSVFCIKQGKVSFSPALADVVIDILLLEERQRGEEEAIHYHSNGDNAHIYMPYLNIYIYIHIIYVRKLTAKMPVIRAIESWFLLETMIIRCANLEIPVY